MVKPRFTLLQQVYLEKIRVLTAGSWGVKAPLCLNNVAWNNRIWPRFYSVGLIEQQISWLRRPKVRLWVWFHAACCTSSCSSLELSLDSVAWGLKISEPGPSMNRCYLLVLTRSYGSIKALLIGLAFNQLRQWLKEIVAAASVLHRERWNS